MLKKKSKSKCRHDLAVIIDLAVAMISLSSLFSSHPAIAVFIITIAVFIIAPRHLFLHALLLLNRLKRVASRAIASRAFQVNRISSVSFSSRSRLECIVIRRVAFRVLRFLQF
jgi:hypothetical protein